MSTPVANFNLTSRTSIAKLLLFLSLVKGTLVISPVIFVDKRIKFKAFNISILSALC